jgi:hypothetical protein
MSRLTTATFLVRKGLRFADEIDEERNARQRPPSPAMDPPHRIEARSIPLSQSTLSIHPPNPLSQVTPTRSSSKEPIEKGV